MSKLAYLRGTAVALSLMTTCQSVLADAEKARLGRVMWTAFECGTYAEMGNDKQRMQVLYEHGIETGRNFIRSIRENQISPEELRKNVPIRVTMRLGGDSDDIMIGRILEAAIEEAYDKVVKRDSNGMPLEISEWVNDGVLKETIARNKYQAANCDLVR